jgi:hypothetical protein
MPSARRRAANGSTLAAWSVSSTPLFLTSAGRIRVSLGPRATPRVLEEIPMNLSNLLSTLIPGLMTFAKRRGLELRDLASANLTVAEVELGIGGAKVKLHASVERIAAWELYIELNTRIATQPLDDDDGLLREALTSLHALFEITRQILKTAGPGVAIGEESLAKYALAILNRVLRPFLARWHSRLATWETTRGDEISVAQHERAWEHHDELRRELGVVREILGGYSEALGLLAGVSG